MEGMLRELEIDESRQTLRATGWEAKAGLPHNEGVPYCAFIRFHCHAQRRRRFEKRSVIMVSILNKVKD